MHPRACYSCKEYKPNLLKPCSQCECEFFCRDIDDQPHREARQMHLNECCTQLQILYNFRMPADSTVSYVTPLLLAEPSTPFPGNLFELLNCSTNRMWPEVPTTQKVFDDFASVCKFSSVATLLYVLIESAVTKNMHAVDLCVHVVLDLSETTFFTEEYCWLLFHWLPNIRNIIVHLVCPEQAIRGNNHYVKTFQYDTVDLACPKRRITLHIHKEKYEQFAADTMSPPPSCIVFINCAFEGMLPWEPELHHIVRLYKHVPVAFTSFYRSGARRDFERLRYIAKIDHFCQVKVLVLVRKNPYRNLTPFRNHENFNGEDPILYSNGYISIFVIQ